MIHTDSYLKYNQSEFGSSNRQVLNQSVGMPSDGQSSKQNGSTDFKLDSLQKSLLESTRRRYTAEENIVDILKGKLTINILSSFGCYYYE